MPADLPADLPADHSRFEAVTRRALLARISAVGLGLAVPSALLAACGDSGDAAVFADATTPASPQAATDAVDAPTTPATEAAPTEADPTEADPTEAAEPVAQPIGGELVVDFVYAAAGDGGRVRNPYIAVWIEDAEESLVATVALWFLQEDKGTRWLNELRRWYGVDGSDTTIDTISGATRTPGDHTVGWDGTTLDGTIAEVGTYWLCIEGAREHGPHSLIRQQITIATDPMVQPLTPDGELTSATVEFIPA